MEYKELDWFGGTYIPDRDGYYLCEVGGVPHTKYAVCKRHKDEWFIWIYFNLEMIGWCGLKKGWWIERWALLEDEFDDDTEDI